MDGSQDVAAWNTYVPPSKWDAVKPDAVLALAPPPYQAQCQAAVVIQAQTRGYLYRTHVWREAEYKKKKAAEKALYRKAPPLEARLNYTPIGHHIERKTFVTLNAVCVDVGVGVLPVGIWF